MVALLGENPQNQRIESRRHIRSQGPGSWNRIAHMSGKDLARRSSVEREAPANHLEQDAPERIDVRARVHAGSVAALLGRHVCRRSHEHSGTSARRGWQSANELGNSKIYDLRAEAEPLL